MDRIAQRYADPFSFLGLYLNMGRFSECVEKIVEAINRETKERYEERLDLMCWMMYVNKYEGKKSFGEWKKDFLGKKDDKPKITLVKPEQMGKNLDIAANTLGKLRQSQKGGD